MSKSTYTVAGVSTLNGVQKLRFANSLKRANVLKANGHTGIALVEMPFAGDTADAVDFLLGLPEFNTLECVREAAREHGFLGYGEAKVEEAVDEAA